ncbi:hypothetical protein SCUCBS95973_007251 [Sporothrix curviconia]|uniref:Uncharacterized protein n=1 Tax=Sporothrix curviconia TaxID=1260050 RepID=A0ABP0CEJ1_9PEZI
MLRVPPPLRPRSRSSSESGSRRSVSHQNSQDSLYNAASAQFCQVTSLASSMDYNDVSHITGVLVASPPQLESPLSSDPSRWDVQPGPVNNGGAAARHRRESSSPSFNGYSNDMSHTWDDGNHAALFQQPHPQQSNPPRMSNGYTGQVMLPYGSGHRRSGSSSSSHSDIYQLQQQQAWDFYYQQYARPPPNVPRGAHHRNRSLGSRHGPVPGPQAPYRILHSYNSPAYRGVPIWG